MTEIQAAHPQYELPMKTNTPRTSWLLAVAATLNAHHRRYGNGFYATRMGGWYFEAWVHDGVLEVKNWQGWFVVTDDSVAFHNASGVAIGLPSPRYIGGPTAS